MITVGILTMSDKGARGEREDLSGEEIKRLVAEIPAEVKAYEVIPDEKYLIKDKLIEYADELGLDIIITTGGTGVSPRDVTPDATLEVRKSGGRAPEIRCLLTKAPPRSGRVPRSSPGFPPRAVAAAPSQAVQCDARLPRPSRPWPCGP